MEFSANVQSAEDQGDGQKPRSIEDQAAHVADLERQLGWN